MRTALLAFLLAAGAAAQEAQDKPLRVGMIGLDTSHVIAFTQLLNDPARRDHVPGARVVCGFKGGSPDVEASYTRVEKFTKDLQEKWGVEIVGSIDELIQKVDAVFVMSVDGRPHLEQVRPVFAAKKRVFIDKPLAGSYRDGKEIVRLSRESGTPFFSASSVRFYESIVKFLRTGQSPVSPEEMLEVLAFMQAADVSKARGGAEVKLAELDP